MTESHVLPVWLELPTCPYMIPQDPFLSFSLSPNPATQRASEHREGTKRPSSAFLELLLQFPPLKLPQPPKSLPEGSIFYHIFTILGHKPSMWWTHHHPLPTTHKISLLSFGDTTSLVPSLEQENPSVVIPIQFSLICLTALVENQVGGGDIFLPYLILPYTETESDYKRS